MPAPPPEIPVTRTDVALVGAGPIGIEMAVALKRAGIDYVHLEAGQVGSTMQWWAPGTRYFSSPERIAIAGVPIASPTQDKATREDYLAYLRAVVQQHALKIRTYTRVERARRLDAARDEGGFELELAPSAAGVGGPAEMQRPEGESRDPAESLRARRLVLAIGDMHRPHMLDIPGEDLLHVSHYLDDPHVYFGERVLIVGGKNSAAEGAIRLYRIGAEVAISYRKRAFDPKRVKYWIRPELEWLIEKGRIAFHPSTVPTAIRPGEVDLAPAPGAPADAKPVTVAADFVLLLTGYRQDGTLFRQLGVHLIGEGLRPEHDRSTMETNVPGVYVAGTGAAGTQVGGVKVFIENAHIHVDRIIAALTGAAPPDDADEHVSLPEA